MKPKHFEVMFSRSGSPLNDYFRVYIELDNKDRAVLNGNTSAELKTRFIVERAGVLELLPSGMDEGWSEFGRVTEGDAIESWITDTEPTIWKGGRKIWIIPEW